jgi:hypothetical protein
MAIDLNRVRERFDEERQSLEFPGVLLEACGSVVRHVSRSGTSSTIVYSRHDPEDLAAAIAAEIRYFGELGHEFEWKTYAHDRPPDLVERLRAAGFTIGPPEAVVVAEIGQVLRQLPETPIHVERLTDPDGLDDYVAVSAGIWSSPGGTHVAETMRAAPGSVGVYVAYIDGVPVGCGRGSFHPDSQFVGLWGGGVLPANRKRGAYLSLVARRAQDAMAAGALYLQADARPTSRPILERLGFQTLSVTHPCTWGDGA